MLSLSSIAARKHNMTHFFLCLSPLSQRCSLEGQNVIRFSGRSLQAAGFSSFFFLSFFLLPAFGFTILCAHKIDDDEEIIHSFVSYRHNNPPRMT